MTASSSVSPVRPEARLASDTSAAQSLERFDIERASLSVGSQLRPAHWVIVALSVVITLAAWYTARSSLDSRAEQRFEREAQHAIDTVTGKIARYESVMRASIAGIATTDEDGFTIDGWTRYVERFDPLSELEAVRAVAIARFVPSEATPEFLAAQRRVRPDFEMHPPHPQPYHLPIVHFGPSRVAVDVMGLDLAAEERRRSTLMRAAYLDEVQMTPPLDLHGSGVRAIILAAPFYRSGETPTWQDRKTDFEGALVATVDPVRLLEPLGDKHRRLTWLTISDDGRLLHDEFQADHPNADPSPMFSKRYDASVLGRKLEFDVQSSLLFRSEVDRNIATLVLLVGLVVDALLLALFAMLNRSNRRAVTLANEITVALRDKAARLEATNAELESFAYVVSHDLKTPLRGIHDLATYIEEDLEPLLEGHDEAPTIGYNFGRIYQQVQRANGLIEGILDYSGVGSRQERVERVDTGEMVAGIVDALDVRAVQVRTVGALPVFETHATRLEQVLANLVGNAFKYHHDPERAEVVISVAEEGDFYRFSVADNGPGIDPRFHARIFEPFKTLQTQDAIQSSGVGLSIVKKSVEALGGQVSVDSTPGSGTTFFFDWPRVIDVDSSDDAAWPVLRNAA